MLDFKLYKDELADASPHLMCLAANLLEPYMTGKQLSMQAASCLLSVYIHDHLSLLPPAAFCSKRLAFHRNAGLATISNCTGLGLAVSVLA